ncbi:MAG: hypothetical protein JF588_13995 [Caulobacterales bacterium]|nr:hypothetical protein [Caulobacterales bacterium]
MTSRVTLQIFSGRPNPTLLLDDRQEHELHERLSGLKTVTDRRAPGAFGGLGYRGFILSRDATHPAGPLSLLVHAGVAEGGFLSPSLVDDSGVEAWLGDIFKGHLKGLPAGYLEAALRQPAQGFHLPQGVVGGCPACHAADAPAYNPGAWNIPAVQPYNNCYNYANNQATNTFAQPGRATGHPAAQMQCGDVQAAATSDGLHAVPNFTGNLGPGQGWYVALVIWPNVDYHWYRQDSVGCWSHKPGQTAVRNVDNGGQPITDPQTCDRGPYVNFCTYMVTTRGVHIR